MNSSNLLVIIIILIFTYSFFSATETAFSSLNRVKIKALSNSGNKKAQKTLLLVEKFSSLLTTILIGNTIVNVVAATLATVYFTNIYKTNGATISSIVMTLVIMIIGEILPKNIAKHIPEKFAMAVTPIMSLLTFIFTPICFIFNLFEKLFSNIFSSEDESYSTEEFITMVEEANEDGEMEDRQAEIITNALEFNDLDVGEIYTPRTDIVAIDINDTSIERIEIAYRDSGFSRLPVYEDTLDNIIGILHVKDFYYHLFYEKSTNIKEILQPITYTSPQVKISSLLKEMQKDKTHMAIVCDEYGGTDGIITMENILEELVGEIYDEHDEVKEYYKKIDENVYLVKADLDFEDMFEHFGVEDEIEREYNSVSAWVIDELDHIPKVSESFKFKNLDIVVTKADEKKVNEIKVIINEKEEDDED